MATLTVDLPAPRETRTRPLGKTLVTAALIGWFPVVVAWLIAFLLRWWFEAAMFLGLVCCVPTGLIALLYIDRRSRPEPFRLASALGSIGLLLLVAVIPLAMLAVIGTAVMR